MQRLFVGLGFICASCGGNPPNRSAPTTLVRISDDDIKSIDPQAASDLATLRLASEQFEGLMRFNADGKAEFGLAQSGSASSDGLSWRFKLRPNSKFSDGEPITAYTFERVFERLRQPQRAAPSRSLFDVIANLRAIDAGTIAVALKSPFPALPELLAHPALAALPVHRASWLHDRPIVASGAYRLDTWTLGDNVTLVANSGWHDREPQIRKVVWRVMSDGLTAVREFEAGRADIVGDVPSSRLRMLRRKYGDQLRIASYRGSYYYVFNTRRRPFSDARVRQALSLAIDRDWIATHLLATGVEPAWSVVPPGIGGLNAFRPAWSNRPKAWRLNRAVSLLKSAGFDDQHQLKFEVRFNTDADHRRVAVALAAMWRPLGVDARLLNSESSLHFASLRRHDFTLARSGWIGDFSAPENFLEIHKSAAGPVNYSGYSSADFDQALEQAYQEPDPGVRSNAMRRAEQILIKDAPALPLYYYVSKSLVARHIIGWRDNQANIHPTRTLGFAR